MSSWANNAIVTKAKSMYGQFLKPADYDKRGQQGKDGILDQSPEFRPGPLYNHRFVPAFPGLVGDQDPQDCRDKQARNETSDEHPPYRNTADDTDLEHGNARRNDRADYCGTRVDRG